MDSDIFYIKKLLRDIKSGIAACPKCGSEELAGEKSNEEKKATKGLEEK